MMVDNLVRLAMALAAILIITGSFYAVLGGASNAAFESRANGTYLAR